MIFLIIFLMMKYLIWGIFKMKKVLTVKDALIEALNMIEKETSYGSVAFTTFAKHYKLIIKNGKFFIYNIIGHLVRQIPTIDFLTSTMEKLELHDREVLIKQQESICIH